MGLNKMKRTWCGDKVADLTDCNNEECSEQLCKNCIWEKIAGNFCGVCCGEHELDRIEIRGFL